MITRTSGLQLGVISHFLVHPRSAAVMFLALREKGLGGADTGGIIPLTALFQVHCCGCCCPEGLSDRQEGIGQERGFSLHVHHGKALMPCPSLQPFVGI